MSDCYRFDNFEELLRETGEYVTQVRGVSMYPMLRYRKDPLLIHPVKGELKPYDVAIYGRLDRYVVHRVLEVRDDIYVIRGDNCICKEYVPKSAVVGVMAGFWRFGRFISSDNILYKVYARVWVAINPLVRLEHRCRMLASALWRKTRSFVS
ncbi:MAG: S24/S26 family peptidase [bacterium]|nr:S24/S26 family peptidase [Candidatus Minthenecus merdequi]